MSNVLVVIYGLTLLFLGLGELALITSGGAAKVTSRSQLLTVTGKAWAADAEATSRPVASRV